MSIERFLSIVVVIGLAVTGCARKQEAAAKLEQEVIEQESGAVFETIVDAGAVPKEALTSIEPTADANAIPSGALPDAESTTVSSPAPLSTSPPTAVKDDSQTGRDVTSAEAAPVLDANAVPAEEPTRLLPQKPAAGGFAVQIAASTELGYARQLADTYASRGYRSYVDETTRGGATFYRVRLGPVATQSEAQAIAREVMGQYGVDAWVAAVSR